jgi:osmotically-inducible protein OsmY
MVKTGNPIERRVLDALDENEKTSGLPIEVVDSEGVVTLEGSVPSREVKQLAEQITEKQKGVVEVINDLKIEEEPSSDDESLPLPSRNM